MQVLVGKVVTTQPFSQPYAIRSPNPLCCAWPGRPALPTFDRCNAERELSAFYFFGSSLSFAGSMVMATQNGAQLCSRSVATKSMVTIAFSGFGFFQVIW